MVTISGSAGRGEHKSREAGVKYFFLGALGAAVFLYGFALLYGATGTTNLNKMYDVFAHGGFNGLALAGMMLALLGLCFKIAAVPMHFYTADVYQGAASGVSAFLAFVPKTAGFIAILLLVSTIGDVNASTRAWLPESIRLMLWVIAALTMTVGNVLAVLQSNVKRVLAYSSIAHSGYMLVGVIAGPGDGPLAHNGIAAVLFYLLVYGTMNVGVFAVLACLEKGKPGGEIEHVETFEDLRGLYAKHPWLTAVMVVCGLGLLGFPPLLGFFGKVPLFTSLAAAGEYPLLIVLALNSAIAAYYYLRLVAVPFLESPDSRAASLHVTPFRPRGLAGVVSAVAVLGLTLVADSILQQANRAANYRGAMPQMAEPAGDGKSSIRDLLRSTSAAPTIENGQNNDAAKPAERVSVR
jgi:NADH-quinone oxidoreductase subunit N